METLIPDIYRRPMLEVVQALLRKHDLHARKSWGQNFLIRDAVYDAIVSACDLSPTDSAIEIGAGLGTLTAHLLHTGARVVALEYEQGMLQVLQTELADQPQLLLRQEDALQTDYAALIQTLPGRVTVVGNLPYYLSTPLLFRLMEVRTHLRHIVVMVQKEVADRLCALPDSEHYGALSAQIQLFADVRRVCRVGATSFLPQPKVESAVVRLVPFAQTRVPVQDLACYQQVVRAAFSQRRKTLRNALSTAFADQTDAALLAAGIDPIRRAETLSVAEFARLSDAFAVQSNYSGGRKI